MIDFIDVKQTIEAFNNKNTVARKINKQIQLVIFGAGFHGKVALEYLKEQGYNVVAFCDNSPSKHGTTIDGLPSIPAGDLETMQNVLVIVAVKHYCLEVCSQLTVMNQEYLIFDEWALSIYMNELEALLPMLYDDLSRQTLLSLIDASYSHDLSNIKRVFCKDKYFGLPDFTAFSRDEVFVDCGAFVGDTIELFIFDRLGFFGKVVAFEPGRRQYEALKTRVNRLNMEWALDEDQIECVFGAVGDKAGFGSMEASPRDLLGACLTMDSIEGSEENTKVYALDDYFGDQRVDFIKSDIEGYELKLLQGAKHIIQSQKPKLAISIYHKPQDYFDIPSYIKALVPEYKMAIRHHAQNLMETVLYCWV